MRITEAIKYRSRVPASACLATLGRIGWHVPVCYGWRFWTDRQRREIDLSEIPTHVVKKLIRRNVAIAIRQQSMLNDDIRDTSGLWLETIRAVICGMDKEIGAMAKSAAIGTQWTQAHVAKAGYATGDTKCRLCNQDEGTLLHRFAADGALFS